ITAAGSICPKQPGNHCRPGREVAVAAGERRDPELHLAPSQADVQCGLGGPGWPRGTLEVPRLLSVPGQEADPPWNMVWPVPPIRADEAFQGPYRHSEQHGCRLEGRCKKVICATAPVGPGPAQAGN